jgi:hypothetical protein
MEPSGQDLPDALSGLGEDLLLLSIRPRDGVILTFSRIKYGLMGSELVRLAAMGRVSVNERQITVLNQIPTGDPELDVALTSLASGKPPRPSTWVGHPRPGIREAYLERLAKAGLVRRESVGRLGRKGWIVPQSRRADQARDRLDAIAYSTGTVDLAQAAFGGLAHAINLGAFLYPKFAERRLRRRLREVGSGKWTQDVADAVSSAASASSAATQAATRAATEAAMRAAVHASTSAAISAAASPPAGETSHHHHH